MAFEGLGGAVEIREIRRHRGLPGSRAVLGGVLMALAAVGVSVAYAQASRHATEAVVVAVRPLRVGQVVEIDDLRTIEADLPASAVKVTFGKIESVAGRVVLGPIGAGELVQSGSVTEDASAAAIHEVAISLPRHQIAVGRLKQGERVDVFVTSEDRTVSVVRGAEVVQIGADDSGSLTSDREITLVVAVPSGEVVAAVVHAVRTGEVTVVRSTFAEPSDEDPLEFAEAGD
ncbi:MAG: SAF domain-containing protein [Acidimicrobiales bacterium]